MSLMSRRAIPLIPNPSPARGEGGKESQFPRSAALEANL
jgi:hypothetical protein